MAQTSESISRYPGTTKEQRQETMEQAVKIVRANLAMFTDKFQSSNSFGGLYGSTENVEWTTGFWTGVIWLAYEYTGEVVFQEAGDIQVESSLKQIREKIDVNHHNTGFLYSLSCVAAYKLTGNEHAKEVALLAADYLAERYREKGQSLQAWGSPGEPKECRLIIDYLLNLPILYWATEVVGEKSYAEKMENHVRAAMKCILQPDHSTYHTHFFDVETREPTYGVTHQRNRNGSDWVRGQAWGVCGIALSYRYLKNPECLELLRRATDYFMEHLPGDLVPYRDSDFDTGSEEPRDFSASVIAICGIPEMVKYLDGETAGKYPEAVDKMLCALIEKYANRDIKVSNGLLLYGTYARDSKESTYTNRGVDECNTWGDYFYMEALARRYKDWELYW